MSVSEDWDEAVAQVAGASTPASSPALVLLYRLACDEARHALRRSPDGVREQVEDIVHKLLFEKLEAILKADNPRSYFTTAVRHAAFDLQRKDRRLMFDEGRASDHLPARGSEPDEVVIARAEAERALALLSPREQEIFSAIAEGEDRDDIAAVLGTTRANIDQIVSRARRRLAGGS